MIHSFTLKNLLSVIVLPVALTVTLGGCQETKNSSVEEESTSSSNNPEQPKHDKVVRVGTEGSYAPFSYHDVENGGTLTGFDVELTREVFKHAGMKVEFVEGPWDSLLAGVDAGRYEVVANQVTITPERQQKYDFSNPYISSPLVIITREDDTSVNTLADIKGKKAAQSANSSFSKVALDNGATIVTVSGFASSIDLLLTSRADVTLNDRLSFLDYKKQRPDAQVKIASTSSESANAGFLVKKGSPELLEAINKALVEVKSNGTYAKISTQFFGTDVSKP